MDKLKTAVQKAGLSLEEYSELPSKVKVGIDLIISGRQRAVRGTGQKSKKKATATKAATTKASAKPRPRNRKVPAGNGTPVTAGV